MLYYALVGIVFFLLIGLAFYVLNTPEWSHGAICSVFGVIVTLGLFFLLFTPQEEICYKTEYVYNCSGDCDLLINQNTFCTNTFIEPVGFSVILKSLTALMLLFFVLMIFGAGAKRKKEREDD